MQSRVPSSIRTARPAELTDLGQLLERAYRASGPLEDDYALILRAAPRDAGSGDVLVAERARENGDDEIVGTVTLCPPGTHHSELAADGELEFRFLAVEPRHWGSGVAADLVRAVIQRGRERGATRMVCCVIEWNEPAHRLYRGFSFSRAPYRDWSPREDVSLLAYELELE